MALPKRTISPCAPTEFGIRFAKPRNAACLFRISLRHRICALLFKAFSHGYVNCPPHTAYLTGTLKPTPGRASGKSVPPEGRPQFSTGPVRYACWRPGSFGFGVCPSGRDGRGQQLKARRTKMSNTDTTESAPSKSPNFIAYQVREGKGKSYFTRIGAAWAHKDGKGFNIQIDAIPLDGKITLRIATDKKD
jgi:hypothetical protein